MRRWIGLSLAGAVLCVAPVLLRTPGAAKAADAEPPDAAEQDALAKVKGEAGFAKAVTPPPLTGVDLLHIKAAEGAVTAPAFGPRVAHLTIDANLQRTAERILHNYAIPEAAVVMTDLQGRVLVWASHVEKGPARDLCAEAGAPAASVFKMVTASALVEQAGLGPETSQCYWGGEQRIDAPNLVDDPKRDKWCATMSEAMGRSLNTVFARLASKHLDAPKLTQTARSLGFGEAPAFDIAVAPNALQVPDDPIGFARTSAGFWNTSLSPLGAASLALTFANHGVPLRPYVVESVTEGQALLYRAPSRQPRPRAIKPETAAAVTTMLESTVSDGTSYKAFHDGAGNAFLPNVGVAGKTGTLTRAESEQFYTWFVGFAPSRAPEVTVAVLAINGANWRVKANVVAREMLRAYFAAKGTPGVTSPKLRASRGARRAGRKRGLAPGRRGA